MKKLILFFTLMICVKVIDEWTMPNIWKCTDEDVVCYLTQLGGYTIGNTISCVKK